VKHVFYKSDHCPGLLQSIHFMCTFVYSRIKSLDKTFQSCVASVAGGTSHECFVLV